MGSLHPHPGRTGSKLYKKFVKSRSKHPRKSTGESLLLPILMLSKKVLAGEYGLPELSLALPSLQSRAGDRLKKFSLRLLMY